MKEIKRDEYLKKLINAMDNGMIKVITGIRRCGKSYLLFKLFKDYLLENGVKESEIVGLSLEDDENREYRQADNLSAFLRKATDDGSKHYYVLLDEVQLAIGKEEAKSGEGLRIYGILNGLLRRSNVDVYVTGSNSRFLSSDVMTEFRGRGDEIRVFPLSFAEFMTVYEGDERKGFEEYITYGGLPMVAGMKSPEEKTKYLVGLMKLVYLKDVAERYNLKGDVVLEGLVDFLASAVGSLTNSIRLANTFKSNGIATCDKTIAQYIGHLEDAFLVSGVKRYDIKGKKYINAGIKYYFTDVGVRNARLNFRQQEPTHLMENIIYNELLARGYNVDVGIVERYSRDKNGKQKVEALEVDFVCNKGSERYYIQSAFAIPNTEKLEQESASFNRIDDSFKKIIIVQSDALPWRSEKGYVIMGIKDFLLNKESLFF